MGYYLELPFMSVEFYVWVVCIGFNVTMLLTYFLKTAESKFISELLTSQAFDEETAQGLGKLKVDGWLIRFLLRDGSTLRKVASLVSQDNDRLSMKKGAKAKVDFENARFYIAEGNLERAKSMKKSAIKWYLLPIFCAVSVGIAIGVQFLVPIMQNW